MKQQQIKIIIDSREGASGLIDDLQNYEYMTSTVHVSTNVEIAQLPIGDVVCSDRVIIERKTCEDFVDSFIDGRLFSQVADIMKSDYARPAMILEGETIFGLRDVHPEALRGAVAGLTVGWGLPIIPTKDVAHTTAMVATIARREQFKMKRSIAIHGSRSKMTLPEQQVYVVAAIRNMGPAMAKTLLERFRTVERVMTASIDELMSVPKVGRKTAETIREVVGTEYKA